ncbi:MAG: DUF1641 domain-containing protein [Hyphomicrobiales bacterium]|nr:DUF1641 domain-containing protein [Hyphomicrobiales bacterium]MDE2018434.1 DUF1641 domain-containing protein [Hyphomicrobiales bacterium]
MTETHATAALDPARRAKMETALAALVDNGDLDRLVALARVVGAAQDSLSDDIVTRLASMATGGLDLLDRVNRSGVAKALPTLTAMIENGDLERLAGLARTLGSAQDSLSDDIVGRLARVGAEALALVDRLTRNGLGMRLLALVERVEGSHLPQHLVDAVETAGQQAAKAPPAKGGIGGAIKLLSDPDNQQALAYALSILKALRRSRTGG